MNNNISYRNNQAFSKEYNNSDINIIDTITEWYNRDLSIVSVLDYIIKSVAIYGINSHPSQTTIGKNAGIKRGWANVLTNKLVELNLIEKTRIIIDGDEQACEYKLTSVLKDSDIGWILKDMLPSLKLLYLFRRTRASNLGDYTPYINIYFKDNFKILVTGFKSISRKQKSKILDMEQRNKQKDNQYYRTKNDLYEIKQRFIEERYKKDQEERLIAASQDEGLVSFMQGLFNGLI